MAKSSDSVRASIIEASAKHFARFGLRKATIDEIARSLRMGKSSLYYYFRSKEDIFKAVIENEVEALIACIRQKLAACSTPQEKLKAFSLARMLFLKDLTNMYSALKDEYLTQYAFIQELRKDYDLRETKLISSILAEGIKKGVFAIRDVTLTGKTIITALKGLEYEWAMKGDQTNIEQNIDILLEILLHGIAAKPKCSAGKAGRRLTKRGMQCR